MLSEDNLCEVYTSRPVICNIDKSKELVYPDKGVKENYKDTAMLCNKWIQEDKMGKKYLIDLKQFED